MQKGLLRKLDLEVALSQVEPHPSPKPNLEQYTIPADVAATMLYIAAYVYNDVFDKRVLDLGCGTGRLALGAALLGAKEVVGVDIDEKAVKIASENSERMNLKEKVQWVAADLNAVRGQFDTVLQNPPFGVQRRKADRKFLEKALEIGKSIYSLHKNPQNDKALIEKIKASDTKVTSVTPSHFLKRFIEEHGGEIKAVYAMVMTIPHMFWFHTKRRHVFLVDLYVIKRK
jgi:putative methylase